MNAKIVLPDGVIGSTTHSESVSGGSYPPRAASNKHIMWIITAPSSGGKSTFIDSPTAVEMTGLRSDQWMQSNHYVKRGKRRKGSFYFHLCMKSDIAFPFGEIIKDPMHKRALVLAVPQDVHKERVKKRTRDAKAGLAPATHPNILLKLSAEKYLSLYEACIDQLKKNNIPYQILHAAQPGYPEVDEADLPQILGGNE